MKESALTPGQLAERWGCSQTHVSNLIDSGGIRAFAINRNARKRRWRIPMEGILEFERSESNQPLPVPTSSRSTKRSEQEYF